MSGTSLDGVDVAVVDIEDRRVNTVAFQTTPYSNTLRQAILNVSDATTTTASISVSPIYSAPKRLCKARSESG